MVSKNIKKGQEVLIFGINIPLILIICIIATVINIMFGKNQGISVGMITLAVGCILVMWG